MVKPETIRKGSKVYFSDTIDEPVTVFDNVNGEISVLLSKLIMTPAEELFPVPLTPQFIQRAGFIKTDDYVFEHPTDGIELEYDYQGVTHMHVRKSDIILQLTTLHELQYAYWLYTKKELNFV